MTLFKAKANADMLKGITTSCLFKTLKSKIEKTFDYIGGIHNILLHLRSWPSHHYACVNDPKTVRFLAGGLQMNLTLLLWFLSLYFCNEQLFLPQQR